MKEPRWLKIKYINISRVLASCNITSICCPNPWGQGWLQVTKVGALWWYTTDCPIYTYYYLRELIFRGGMTKLFCLPSEMVSTLKEKKSPSKGSTFFPFWVDPFSEQVQGSYRQGQVKCKDFSRTNLIVIYLALSFIGSTSSENLCFEKLNNNNNVTMNSLKIQSLFLPWQRNLGMSKTSCFLFSYAPLPLPVTALHFTHLCNIHACITWLTVHLMFTVQFLYPRISYWPISAINTLSH